MKIQRIVLTLGKALIALGLWGSIVVSGTIKGWWRNTIAPRDNADAFLDAAIADIQNSSKGNAALVLLEKGQPAGEYYFSVGQSITKDTQFQIASVSKYVSAWGVMKLVEEGKLDLDTPVVQYLTRWTFPESEFSASGVTIRGLLSHTAGLTDGLGYAGFAPKETPQSLEASLTQAADAFPGNEGKVTIGVKSGRTHIYSGGGYTLLQLLIEEVSNQSFNDFMIKEVFTPLGMSQSTYILDPQATIAESYDEDGRISPHYQYTALAAASLYTSMGDLTTFMQAHLTGPNGEVPGRRVLEPETLQLMRQPHGWEFGKAISGLGATLYADNNAGEFIIGHDGSNRPNIKTTFRFDPATGDGIIFLGSGNGIFHTPNLGSDWVYWNVGNIDVVGLIFEAPDVLRLFLLGSLPILLIVGYIKPLEKTT